jgi:uncharacterized delta-60 repeat protein
MTKITDYLATVTDVNSVFPAVGPAVPNSERCVIKDETGETAGSVGALNHWQIDPAANPLVTYTNPRLPRWQDLVPLITTTTTTTILNCNFTFSTLQVPVASTTTTTTSTSTSTTTTTTTLPLNEWYILYNCSNGGTYNSDEYPPNSFELNDRVTTDGVTFYYVTGIINYNPGGAPYIITAVAGQTFCPSVPTTTTTTTIGGGFGGGTRYNNDVDDTIIQSNGNIMSVGLFTLYNSISQFLISVLNPNGSINSSFNNYFSGSSGGGPLTIEQQKIDNKVIVGGNFTSYNSVPTAWGIMRINIDGSVDNSFNNAPNFGLINLSGVLVRGSVLALKTQLDGKVVVGGNFTRLNGTLTYNCIARLNSDGSIDGGFTIGSGFNNNIYQHGIQLQSDNKLIVTGAFSTYNGVSANCIIRLNTDGTKDTSFNYGTGFARTGLNPLAYASDFQSSGKIITVGIFERYNGTTSNNIVRINTNGSIDNTFAVGTGLSAVAGCVAIQSDDKILVGGNFTSYNGNASNRLVRLNSNGTYDNTFNVGTGFGTAGDAYVDTIVIQSDGKIVVSGAFTTYNGTTVNRIIRLNTDGSIDN